MGANNMKEGFYASALEVVYQPIAMTWLACYNLKSLLKTTKEYSTTFPSDYSLTPGDNSNKSTVFSKKLLTIISDSGSFTTTVDKEFADVKDDISRMLCDISGWGLLNSVFLTEKSTRFTEAEARDYWWLVFYIWKIWQPLQRNLTTAQTKTNTTFLTLTQGDPTLHITEVARVLSSLNITAKELYIDEASQLLQNITSWGVLNVSCNVGIPKDYADILKSLNQSSSSSTGYSGGTGNTWNNNNWKSGSGLGSDSGSSSGSRSGSGSGSGSSSGSGSGSRSGSGSDSSTNDSWPGPEPSRNSNDMKWKSKSNCWKRDNNLDECRDYEPECPDMSQYIKKDEIPCWNCTL